MPAAAANPIDTLVRKVNKDLGEGTLLRGSDIAESPPRLTSGSLAIDLMLGGGWPVNCWTELVGDPSSGKSLIAMKTLAANMATDKKFTALWVASEPYVPEWAVTCGMDPARTIVVNTRIMEEAYQIVLDALNQRLMDAVVIDSLSALTPKEEDEKDIDELAVALGARLTNKFMRKSGTAQRRSLVDPDRPCLGIIISQWREKVGGGMWDNRTTPYGRGKEFHYMIRAEVRRSDWIERGSGEKKVRVGMTLQSRTVKNKTAPPQRVAAVDFYWQTVPGFEAGDYDSIKELSNIALAFNVVPLSGSYYSFNGRQWHGKDAFLADLRSEVDLRREIEAMVRNPTTPLGVPPVPASAPRRKMKRG